MKQLSYHSRFILVLLFTLLNTLPICSQAATPRYRIAACDWMMLKRQKLGEFKLAHELGADGVEVDRKMVEENMRPFMEEVMDVMEKNYDNSEFGVQELADALGISRSVLSKNLSQETGLPTAQFIRNYRLDISRKMMADKTSNRNITEIAYRVGFNDPKYFTRCFTK